MKLSNLLLCCRYCCFCGLFMVVSAWLAPVPALGDCVAPPAGLLSWWAGEGSTADLVGGNDGSLANGATYAPGYVGQGFVLNGNGAAVQVGNATNLQLQDFTIEGWAARSNPSEATTFWTGIGFIFSFGVGGYGFAENNAGQLVLSQVGVTSVGSPNLLTDSNFHHIAVTKSGSTVVFYVDGTAYPAPTYNPAFTFSSPAAIGAQGNDLTSSFEGTVDEISVYNRALDASEIQAIYAAGTAGKCQNTAPIISSSPKNYTTLVGGSASFTVYASGTQPLSYQWLFSGSPLAGATDSSLTLSSVQTSDAGYYSVQVTNVLGAVTSAPALLTVIQNVCLSAPPGLVSWWGAEGDGNDSGYGGNTATLLYGTTFGPGEVGQAFNFDGVTNAVVVPAAPNLASQSITAEAWLYVTDASTPRPIFEYANPTGRCAMNFWYNLGPGPNLVPGALYGFFRAATNPAVYVQLGSPGGVLGTNQWNHVALTFDASSHVLALYANGVNVGVTTSSVPIVWQSFENVNLGYRPDGSADAYAGRRHVGLLDEASIYDRALSADEVAAIYYAGANGKCALGQTGAFIMAQPANQSVAVGGAATFTVAAGGNPAVSYEWFFNNASITDATNAWLTLTNLQTSDAGNYSVLVSNAVGSVTSSNAVLQVRVVSIFGNGALLTGSQYAFDGSVTISMQNVYTNGLIFYTLDGSTPTFSSAQYTNPFVLTQNATVRALGYSADFLHSGQSGPIDITVIPTYTLSVLNAGGGTVALTPPTGPYGSNTVVNVTATPATGWTFLQWLGDADGTNPAITLTMTRNKVIQAVFGTTLSTTAAGGGTVVLNPAGGVYPYGTVVQLSAVPQPGNYFALWGNGASGNTNPLVMVVRNPNVTVSSLFSAVGTGQAALTVVPVGQGQVTVNPRANVYTTGQNVSVTASPTRGQAFLGWSGDATGTQNPLALVMNTNKLIYATFSDKPALSLQAAYDGLKTDGFQLTLLGDFGAHYRIDTTTDFASWTPLGVVTNWYGTVQFNDPGATVLDQRFYRAVQVP